MQTVYFASGFNRRQKLRELAYELKPKGYTASSSWIYLNERPDRGSDQWEDFAKKICCSNLIDMLGSDILVIDTEGIKEDNHGGVHSELGFFLGRDKPIYLVGPRGLNTFHWLPSIIQVDDYEELKAVL